MIKGFPPEKRREVNDGRDLIETMEASSYQTWRSTGIDLVKLKASLLLWIFLNTAVGYALRPFLLARICNVLIFCLIRLMWPDYVYHWFAWCPYQTFPLSRYSAALMCPGSLSYPILHLHGHASPLAHLPFHQFWHAWVMSVAITKISSSVYTVPYQASVSPCSACWCIASACTRMKYLSLYI